MLSSPGPPSAASLCSLTRFFFCRGVQSRPTLVVLCKTQPRGRDVTPIEGEAQGTMCVCTHSDVYPWCLFFSFFFFNPVCSSAGGRPSCSLAAHNDTQLRSCLCAECKTHTDVKEGTCGGRNPELSVRLSII